MKHQTTSSDYSGPSRRGFLRGSAITAAAGLTSLGLAACSVQGPKAIAASASAGGGPAPVAASGSAAELDYSNLKGKTVGIVSKSLTSEGETRLTKIVREVAEANDFTLDIVDTNGDFKKASDTLKLFAEKEYAGVLIQIIDPNLLADGCAALTSAGIPFGTEYGGNPGAGSLFDVTSTDYISGVRVATYVKERIRAQGREGGVAIFNYTGALVIASRVVAYKSVLGEAGIPVLDAFELKVPGQVVDAQQKTQTLLTKYPRDGQLLAIMGGWDEVGYAAAQTIKSAGRDDVFAVGVDGNDATFAAIREGWMAATCFNDFGAIGSVALSTLSDVIGGTTPASYTIYVDAPFVASQNVPAAGQVPVGAGVQTFYAG